MDCLFGRYKKTRIKRQAPGGRAAQRAKREEAAAEEGEICIEPRRIRAITKTKLNVKATGLLG